MNGILKQLPFQRLTSFGAESAGGEHALGLMVTERALYGVLLERGEGGTRVVRHLSRQRSGDTGPAAVPAEVPDFEEESAEDFSIQFGDGASGGGGGDLFLANEFGDLSEGGATGNALAAPAVPAPGFALELQDLLSECRDAGYERPAIAFCLGAADVVQVELLVLGTQVEDGQAPPKVKPKKLFELLADQYAGAADAENTAFLPMTPSEEGLPRYLTLVAPPTNPVATTLERLRDAGGDDLPNARLLETEVPVYLGLARAVLRRDRPARSLADDATDADAPSTLLVRAGAEDTLVLFLQGETLHHTETLRSLSAYDAPETICSRVLLLQDEYDIGEIDRVLIVSEEEEEELAGSFEMFFPEARVEPLKDLLPGGEEAASGVASSAPASAAVPATGAALRLADHAGFKAFEKVNLLPKSLLRRRFKLRMPGGSWHIPALLAVLAALAFFFAARYTGNENAIEAKQAELERFPAAEQDARLVQARIDSLQGVVTRYTRGLSLLDELLMGGDQWSQALHGVSRATSGVKGVWVEGWTPQQEDHLQLTGNATSRDRIVELADRLDGTIQQVSFSEIREWPVYSFTMTMPLKTGLPETTRYLREQALSSTAAASSETSAE